MEKNSGRKMAQRKIKTESCEMCGGNLILQRHHKNGDATDNSQENIAVLCQKCHTKTHMMIGDWGRGKVMPAICAVCGEMFKPKRSRRAKLCGSPECAREHGRKSAELRWG